CTVTCALTEATAQIIPSQHDKIRIWRTRLILIALHPARRSSTQRRMITLQLWQDDASCAVACERLRCPAIKRRAPDRRCGCMLSLESNGPSETALTGGNHDDC